MAAASQTPESERMPSGVLCSALLAEFVKAARKQEKTIHAEFGGWGHALWCNYQRDIGNGQGRCNCGVADMLTALRNYDSANVELCESAGREQASASGEAQCAPSDSQQ